MTQLSDINAPPRDGSGPADERGLHLMFGGTFDPIHHGHLRMAIELREAVQRQTGQRAQVHLVPCRLPPHRRSPGADADQRLQMLALALTDEPGLVIDRRELESPEPSYSVATLAALRAELGPQVPLAMAIGTDSFAGIEKWHRWSEIIGLAHIIVIERPGYQIPAGGAAAQLLAAHRVQSLNQLTGAAAGKVLSLSLSLLDISATDIRTRIADGRSARYLIPDTVWRYICDHSLYRTL